MTATAAVPAQRASRPRRIAYRTVSIAAGGYAALDALASLLHAGLAVGNIHRVQSAGRGVFMGVVAAGFLLQARCPQRRTALFQQLGIAVVALLAATALADLVDPRPLEMVAVLAVIGALHPARTELLRVGSRPSIAIGAAALAAAVPLILYGLAQTAMERTAPAGDLYSGQWTQMAATAFLIPLVGLVAALGAPGWRICGWSAGVGAVVLGLAWALLPSLVSSPGVLWGGITIVAGAAFLALCEWEARRLAPVAAPR